MSFPSRFRSTQSLLKLLSEIGPSQRCSSPLPLLHPKQAGWSWLVTLRCVFACVLFPLTAQLWDEAATPSTGHRFFAQLEYAPVTLRGIDLYSSWVYLPWAVEVPAVWQTLWLARTLGAPLLHIKKSQTGKKPDTDNFSFGFNTSLCFLSFWFFLPLLNVQVI